MCGEPIVVNQEEYLMLLNGRCSVIGVPKVTRLPDGFVDYKGLLDGVELFYQFSQGREVEITQSVLDYIRLVSYKTMIDYVHAKPRLQELCRHAALQEHWANCMEDVYFFEEPDRPVIIPQEGINNFDILAGAVLYFKGVTEKKERGFEQAADYRFFPVLVRRYRSQKVNPVESEDDFYQRTGFSKEHHGEAAEFMFALHFLWYANDLRKKGDVDSQRILGNCLIGLQLLQALELRDIDYGKSSMHNVSFGLGQEGLFRILFDDKRDNWVSVKYYLAERMMAFGVPADTAQQLLRTSSSSSCGQSMRK